MKKNKSILFVFLCAVLWKTLLFGADREVDIILIPESKEQEEALEKALKKRAKKLRRDIRKEKRSDSQALFSKAKKKGAEEIQKFDIDLKYNFTDIRYTKFQLGSRIKSIDKEDVIHDVVKGHYGKDDAYKRWNKLSLRAGIAFPFMITFPSLVGPLGLDFSFEPGWFVNYSIISRGKNIIKNEGKIFKNVKEKFEDSLSSIKTVRIPLKADKIIDTYDEGTDLIHEGLKYLAVNTGIVGQVPGVEARLGISAAIESQAIRTITILEKGKENFIALKYEKSKVKSRGTNADLNVGVTLFEKEIPVNHKWMEKVKVKGELKVNVISSRSLKSKEDYFMYHFIYDLKYPSAKKALQEAIKGNLIPSQELAVNRYEVDKFQGVLLKGQVSDLVYSAIKENHFGLRLNESVLENSITNLKAKEKLGRFLSLSREKKKIESFSKKDSLYKKKGELQTFSYHSKKDNTLFFELFNTYRDIEIISKLVKGEYVSSGQRIDEFQTYKVTANFLEEIEDNKNAIDLFLTKASKVAGWNNQITRKSIESVVNNNSCSKGAKMTLNMTLYEEAIKRILSYKEVEVWSMAARFIDDDSPGLFRYKKTRDARMSEYKTLIKSVRGGNFDYQRWSVDYYTWAKDFIEKLEKQEIIPQILSLQKKSSKQEQLKAFHDLVSSYDRDENLIQFLLVLAQGDQKGRDKGAGVLLKYSLKSDDCEFFWSMYDVPDLSVSEAFHDWKELERSP